MQLNKITKLLLIKNQILSKNLGATNLLWQKKNEKILGFSISQQFINYL